MIPLSRFIFRGAGAYGLIALLPMYFLEDVTSRELPPAITHPEHYYGFIGVAVAWQLAFLVIGSDPERFRPLMIPSVVEKLSFGLAVPILYTLGRVSSLVLAPAVIDLFLGIGFIAAYRTTNAMYGRPSTEPR